ncbi:hypothetical protein [Thauera humireducens]|uniref:hypothetical protein n=1 Tax=Thauera humireducens TaxID=1134435 RepID=UPI00311E1F10
MALAVATPSQPAPRPSHPSCSTDITGAEYGKTLQLTDHGQVGTPRTSRARW